MKVFISSTYDDLADYRIALRDFLKSLDHEPLMLPVPVDNDIPDYRKLIDETEVFIGIYAHRYGILPKGDEQSLIEQEYRYAVEKGKDIICYIVDPAADWDEKWKEDDFIKRTRLEAFLENLRKDHPVATFRSPKDIIRHARPLLDKFSDIYDRIKHLTQWSETLPDSRKLAKIAALAGLHQRNALGDNAFQMAARLISRDFRIDKNDPSYPYIDAVEKLLKDELTPTDFSSRLPPEPFFQHTTDRRALLRGAIFAVPALLIGLLIGAFFLSSKSETGIPVETAQPAARIAQPSAPGNEIASVNTENTIAEQQSPTTDTPPENRRNSADVNESDTPPTVSPQRETAVQAQPDTPPAEQLRQQTTPQNSAPATENRRKTRTENPPAATPPAAAQQLAGARIAAPENLVVCADVDRDTRMPVGANDTLSAGTIWMWARFTSDRADSIRAEWFLNGQRLGSRSARIPGAVSSYRIYFSRFIDPGSSGAGRLLLYNGNGEQIGERTFQIVAANE